MKKRITWLCAILLLLATAIGMLYEASTHVGRGWLRGEAFFDGRPTSYWRLRCDEWLALHRSPDDAAQSIPGIAIAGDPDSEPREGCVIMINSPPATIWSRMCAAFHSREELLRELEPPSVLCGFNGTEAVLQELAAEPKYQRVALRGLRLHKAYRELENTK